MPATTTRPSPAELAAMTPAEVDTLLAPKSDALATLQARHFFALDAARSYDHKAEQARSDRAAESYRRAAATKRAEADALAEPIDRAREACAPFWAEYERRGGWPRIFWCTSNGGHAHRSLTCRTLHPTTGMVWIPEMSGSDEPALVAAAGESACTVCYPSAPVDALARPSTLRPAVEEREARQARQRAKAEEKAARDAERERKGITAPDGSPLVVDRWQIKTETTARNGYVSAAADAADLAEGLGYCHPDRREELAAKYAGHAAAYLAALAHKHGRTIEEERADLAPKVAARRAKDARERARRAR